ncbi:MAG TPA: NUDIX hydrolase [Myxococcota bacterium]|nr:NUDIX hydrolase [Myxococcota bacterium]
MAVIRREGRVLAIRRGPEVRYAGFWSLPSGRIEPGESQPQAVVREAAEELGLSVTPLAKVWECLTDDGEYALHWWTAGAHDFELALDAGEVSEARWVTASEYLALEPTFALDREFFARVLPTLAD